MKRDFFLHRAALASIPALALVSAMPAEAREAARPTARSAPAAQAAGPEAQEPPGSWTAGTAPRTACIRARHKLWQEGEGWIVKAITTCR